LLKYKTRAWEKTARQIFFILAFIENLNRVESHGACHRAAHFFLAKIEEMYAVILQMELSQKFLKEMTMILALFR